MRAVIKYTPSEMRKINRYFPNLSYSNDTIKGEIDFSAKYHRSKRKKNEKWEIVPCSSGRDCIQDVYEIEIRLNELRDDKPKVFEVGGRIKGLALELNEPVDLHLHPIDEDCCLGIFLHNSNETLSDFIKNKVYPYFVWQAYFEKFRKIPPVGEWSHGELGYQEFDSYVRNNGRNQPCPCGSGKKFKICCWYEVRSTTGLPWSIHDSGALPRLLK